MEVQTVELKFDIHLKDVSLSNKLPGKVYHEVSIFGDGSIYLKEVVRMPGDQEKLHSAHMKHFGELREKFPEDARLIQNWFGEHGITMQMYTLK